MNPRALCFLVLTALCAASVAHGQSSSPGSLPNSGVDSSSNSQLLTKIPPEEILVKGAWSSATDSVTPVPEDGNVAKGVFTDPYFGITYALPPNWIQEYEGPPPSESGLYVLAQIGPPDNPEGPLAASMLITAQDMFFTSLPLANAFELTHYIKDHLQADYQVEIQPTQTNVAGGSFTFFAYWSPVAQLHWYVLATDIRCHALQIILTSRDTKLLRSLMLGLNRMKLRAEAGPASGAAGREVPLCIKDYVHDENMLARQEPVFTGHRFNSVPVRIIIDKQGRVRHVHFISAFPDQAKAIADAVLQWKFKPYLKDGQPVEIETGISFGPTPHANSLFPASAPVK